MYINPDANGYSIVSKVVSYTTNSQKMYCSLSCILQLPNFNNAIAACVNIGNNFKMVILIILFLKRRELLN